MSVAIVIPARYESSRFPGKPLCDLLGRSLIYRVWSQCIKSIPAEQVFIATDDNRIANHCKEHDMQFIITSEKCLTGTDRVYEASLTLNADTVVNVQGDEPCVVPEDILKIIELHQKNPDKVCYGMAPILDESKFRDHDLPKIVTDPDGHLLYSSRAPIPASKDNSFTEAWQQVCVSAFSPEHLKIFAQNEKTPLEQIEDVEVLRFLELGVKVLMTEMTATVAVDRENDVCTAVNTILSRYKTWIFDCDGVLLNSNDIKTNAFYSIAKQFGKSYADEFLEYHQNNGGVSRFEKFKYLQTIILQRPDNRPERDQWIKRYSNICHKGLLSCDLVPGVSEFLSSLLAKKYVVSGGEQNQLRRVLSERKFKFDGIYGSPRSKMEILRSLNIEYPAIFVGDAWYDYKCACEFNLDFMFVNGYSDISEDHFKGMNCFITKDFKIQ